MRKNTRLSHCRVAIHSDQVLITLEHETQMLPIHRPSKGFFIDSTGYGALPTKQNAPKHTLATLSSSEAYANTHHKGTYAI